jgi:hypothetical protein
VRINKIGGERMNLNIFSSDGKVIDLTPEPKITVTHSCCNQKFTPEVVDAVKGLIAPTYCGCIPEDLTNRLVNIEFSDKKIQMPFFANIYKPKDVPLSKPNEITVEQHMKRHKELHLAFDELAADYVVHTGRLLSKSSLMDLIEWSYKQTVNPTVKSHPKGIQCPIPFIKFDASATQDILNAVGMTLAEGKTIQDVIEINKEGIVYR